MRKFLAFLGVMLTMLGLRLYDNGLLSSGFRGTYTVYGRDGSQQVYSADTMPSLDRADAYATRLDIAGGEAEALQVLKNLNVQIKWRETFDDGLVVLYGFSPDIFRSSTVKGTKINIMAAYGTGGTVKVGCPLLMGSY